MTPHTVLLLVSLLAACGPATEAPAVPGGDRDGDGDPDASDCAPEDPRVHAGAPELCDGLDNDCDGTVDGAEAHGAELCYADDDGDGVGTEATSAWRCDCDAGWSRFDGDCDDTDPEVLPGAREQCGGGDEDCDGLTDEAGAEGMVVAYPDADADGWGVHPGSFQTCTVPAGHVDLVGDCDDTDPEVSPGAAEVWYDGLDQDCAGDDDHDADGDGVRGPSGVGPDCDDADPAVGAPGGWLDVDGDGYGDPDAWAKSCSPGAAVVENDEDCDDADPEVSPDAAEICDDGIDNNCDGSGAPCALNGAWSARDASFELRGTYSGALAGVSLHAADVVGGDGVPDLLVSATAAGVLAGTAPGEVAVVRGPISRDSDLDTWPLLSTTGTELHVGKALSARGDVDGDGYLDLLVGAPEDTDRSSTGTSWLLYGPVSGSVDLSGEAAVSWRGDDKRANMGVSVLLLDDQDGDGGDEAVVVASLEEDCLTLALGLGTAVAREVDLHCGSRVGHVGDSLDAADVNGDGVEDLLVGSSYYRATWVLLGPVTGARELDGTDGEVWDGSSAYKGGPLDLADMDGDGVVDLVSPAPSEERVVTEGGSVYGLLGPLTGRHDMGSEHVFEVYGTVSGGKLGDTARVGGDVDGDGLPEVWLGWTQHEGDTHGAVLHFLGPLTGTVSAEDADGVVEGISTGDQLGRSVLVGPDLTGDGTWDLLTGAVGLDQGSGGQDGGVYIFAGGGSW